MEGLREFITANPILAASLSSLWGAIVIDLIAFRSSKEPGSFIETFSLKVAALRYLQAFIGGFVGNAAVAGVVGAVGGATALVLWLW